MKKVLVFATTFPTFTLGDATPGFVYELSHRLASEGLDITVLTPRVPGAKKYEERDGLKIYRYSYFFFSKWEKLNDGAILPNIKQNKFLYFQIPFLLFASFFSLIKICKKEKIQVIHAHWIIPQGLLAVIYKKIFRKNIKIICTTHGGDIFGLKGKIGSFLKKYTLKNIDTLTVVSTAIKQECLKLGADTNKISVIPMGVDTDKFHPKNRDENLRKELGITGKMLLFVGRLAEKKGVTYLLDAIPKILSEYPDTKLVIIGNGPLEKQLKKQTEKLGIKNSVVYLGAIENSLLPKYYASADIFIGPSIIADDGDREGLPVTYMEALASGTILIGTNLEGNKDIIKDGINGYMIRQRNSNDIFLKIQLLFHSRIELTKHSSKEFSWEKVSEKYFSLMNI